MEQALYHPLYGYYGSGRARIGRSGDYFTSVSVGPLFGALVARQFAEMWDRLDRPSEFTIVEQGGHDGSFAADALSALQSQDPACFSAVHYRLVDPSDTLRDHQRQKLSTFAGRVDWFASLSEMP